MSVGDNIRSARINKKMNQRELAKKLTEKGIEIGNTTISNWENNISKPDPDTISSICEILDVDANYILGFYSDKKIEDKKTENDLKELLKKKGLMDDNDYIDKESADKLIKIIDILKEDKK